MTHDQAAVLLDRFAAIPYTGAISDILDEMGFPDQALPHEIRSMTAGQTLAGRALTLLGEPTESDDPEIIFVPFLKMLGEIGRGDVLVSQPNDSNAAHLGELSSETAQFRGARGAIIDGGVRDTAYIRRLNFPVYARYTTPKDISGRWRLTDFNTPICISGVTVRPGDFIVGDDDGVVVVPAGIAESVVAKAEEVVRTENQVRKAVLEGMHPLEAYRRHGRF